MFESFMQKFVRWLDPKFDKYRIHRTKPPAKLTKYTPTTLEDFINVLKRTPQSVLSSEDRNRISAIMSFDTRIVSDLMVPKSDMVFVNAKDILGPLTLDKLYKSGFTNFPVVNNDDEVQGIIHTEALNALEIKRTDRAEKYMTPHVNYLRASDTLRFAIQEIERTNSYYFLVLDSEDRLAGFFTIQMLLDYLLK